LIAGVLTIIPFLGAIISVIPSLLVALSTDPILAIWVIFIFLGTHFVEDIFAPLIQQKITSVPPALLVSTQIFLTFIGGFLGLLLAEPLCLMTIVTVQIIYVKGILGEDIAVLGEKRK
jgi:predicted PurR-regulated permease PerM